MKMKKQLTKWISLTLTSIMLIGAFTGCSNPSSGDSNGTDNESSSNSSETNNDTNMKVKSIVIGSSDVWDTLSPFRTTSGQYNSSVRYIYDRLALQTADNRYIPQVAKSWDVADDGITWNIELFDYVTDSEGNNITASDIVWVIEENMRQALKPAFNKVESVEQTGDYSLIVTMKQDVVNAFELILASTYVVSQKAYEESADGFATSAITTSPYTVVELVTGSSLTLEKRDDYWQKEELLEPEQANNLDKITYKIIKEASQQQIALETGTVDAFESLSATTVNAFENNSDYDIVKLPSVVGLQLYFSGDESRVIADDVNLRRAIAYAIDAEGIVQGTYNGYATIQHDSAIESVVGYLKKWNEEEYFPYDVDLAKKYLAESSYNDQELEMLVISNSTMQRSAQMIQSYLMAVGINLKLNIVDSALFSASRFDGAQYDIIMIPAGAGSIPNFWGNRYDATSYDKGDGTARNDMVLTDMIHETWQNSNFTEENIDKVRNYINDKVYAYGICLPTSLTVYKSKIKILNKVEIPLGTIDFAACTYE